MNRWLFIALLFVSLAIRFVHFDSEIQMPHAWRQSDTANYIRDFHENGIDLLHPSVCWLGDHKTLVFEFPLVEGLVAVAYDWFGPYHSVAKIVFFLFFLGSCGYFFLLVRRFSNHRIAQMSLLFYCLAPLSLHYSTAIHIDYSALLFSFAMVFYFVRAIDENKRLYWIVGSLFATLAVLTKVPYVFAFGLPLVLHVTREKKWRQLLMRAVYLLIPIAAFVLWQRHVYHTNDAAPDWDFIPGYRKFTDNSGWYFGHWAQRMELGNWTILWERLTTEVLGICGIILAVFGIFTLSGKRFFMAWLAGTIGYVLVFFNLNVVHNYYQLPFVPILAVFAAFGVAQLADGLPKWKTATASVLIILSGWQSFDYASEHYFKIPHDQIDIGKAIRNNTDPSARVMINYGELDSKCPKNILYQSHRNGWQLPSWGLNARLVFDLMLEGADYLAIVRHSEIEGEMAELLAYYGRKVLPIEGGLNVYLYETKFSAIWSMIPEEEKVRITEKLGDEIR